jgi:hypothetical protein
MAMTDDKRQRVVRISFLIFALAMFGFAIAIFWEQHLRARALQERERSLRESQQRLDQMLDQLDTSRSNSMH